MADTGQLKRLECQLAQVWSRVFSFGEATPSVTFMHVSGMAIFATNAAN